MVILKLIELMRRLFELQGIDLCLLTYDCISTGSEGNGQGYIQVVEGDQFFFFNE